MVQFEPRAAKVGGGCEGGVGGERWSLGRKKGEVWGRGWPGLREKTRDFRQDTGKRIDTGLEDDSGERTQNRQKLQPGAKPRAN